MKRILILLLSLYICAGVLYGQNLNPYEQFGYTPKGQYVMTKTPQGITLTNTDKEINVAKLVLGLKNRRMFFFDEKDSLLNVITIPEDIFIRFISVDPLTGKYPELTPYQYASNRPIDGIDLDGLEHAAATMSGGFNQNARESVSNTSFPDPRSYLRQAFQQMKQRQGSIKPGREGLTFWQNVQLSISKLKLTSPAGGHAAQTLYSTVDDVYITYTNIKYGRGNAFDLTGEQTSYKQTIGAGLNTFSMAIGGVQGAAEKALLSESAGLLIGEQGSLGEAAFGSNLNDISPNFPVFDNFVNGTATSAKSLDLTAATYLDRPSAITSTLNGYTNKIVNFTGARRNGYVLTPSMIESSELGVLTIGSATRPQVAAISAARAYAQSQGVQFTLKNFTPSTGNFSIQYGILATPKLQSQ